jgi:hypothetical protein
VFLFVLLATLVASPARGQHDHHEPARNESMWTWTSDANVFFGHNYQQRQFLDASAWESQNWVMTEAGRDVGSGLFSFTAMLSLEPWTMARQGSPQLFQTGETYRGAPLVHYQHPHDLLMGLGGTYRWSLARARPYIGADLVGAPTLGPVPFMHRESARNNTQAPLAHHLMDSTHITPGVLRGGVTLGPATVEASVFRGLEPDENRLDVDRPRLDSWAARIRFERRAWSAQASVGHLHQPERLQPYDVTRITASISFDGQAGRWPLHMTAGLGADRQFTGFNANHEGYLLEWNLNVRPASTIFGRAEVVEKDLFPDPVPHPKGQGHPHYFSTITATTVGFVQDLRDRRWGRIGVGVDGTIYRMPVNMQQFWGGSRSFHTFVRWRPGRNVGQPHVH